MGGPAALSVAGGCARTGRREQRRRRFVEVAERLFLEKGFAGASVNEVVRIAGGSLATLYAEFPTKDDLFEAVITRRAARMFDDEAPALAARGDARERILELAARIQSAVLSPDSLAMFRLAVSEGPRFESLRRAVLDVGMERYLARLGARLADIARDRGLDLGEPREAAGRLLALVAGQIQFAAACGDDSRTAPAARRRDLERAVDAFVATCGGATRS